MRTITVFEGDGIGPEIMQAVLRILNSLPLELTFDVFSVGEAEYERNGKLIPDEAYASFEKHKILLKAPITTPIGKGYRSLNVTLRKKYDMYANIRPAKSIVAIQTPYEHIDLVTFRENTEDLYVGIEEQIDDNTVHATKIITRHASERIITQAFEFALQQGRKQVTCVHKANIMKLSDGLFLTCFYEIAKKYPQIQANDKIIDAMCMELVMHPQAYDVMVMPNLYGDIVSDLTSGLIGGLGVLPSSNIGDEYAMFEAVHGSAPDIAGKHIANPSSLLLSACMMLDYMKESDTANQIRNALFQVFTEHQTLTPDLGGSATTEQFCEAILEKLS